MKKLLGIFIIGLLWSNVGVADYMKLSPIGKMYEDCTLYIKAATSGTPYSDEDKALGVIFCSTYFDGLDAGVLYQGINSNIKLPKKYKKEFNTENVLGSCLRDPKYNHGGRALKEIMIKLFVRYVEDNPKKIEEMEKDMPDFYPIQRVVSAALREKYPCN